MILHNVMIRKYEKPRIRENTGEILEIYTDEVRGILRRLKLDVPFFIAGGAAFSLLNNSTKYNDVDIYFYSEKDVNSFILAIMESELPTENITKFAISVESTHDIIFQFIISQWGDVFKTFDLTNSMCGFTSECEKNIWGRL